MKIITAIKNNYGKYLAKAAGAAAVGLVGYDAHTVGKLNADTYAQTKMADYCSNAYDNSMYLTEPSIVQSKLKDKLFHMRMETNIGNLFNTAAGYFSGAIKMLVSNVIPLGLGLTALFGSIKKHPAIVKWSGIGVAAYAGVKFVRDICGLGQKNHLNSRFK